MSRLSAGDFDPQVLRLFDAYVHGLLSRRGFLDGAQRFATAAGTTSAALLAALSPRFAEAQQVPPNDARLKTRYVQVTSPRGNGQVRAYLAQPAAAQGRPGKPGTVLVIHENRGLNPHIEDIARRLALEGFIALAPDALTPLGGYPGDEDRARELFGKLDAGKTLQDFIACAAYLKDLPDGNGKVGAVGFCWGGGLVNQLAVQVPDLAAGVPFYGGQPSAADAARIKAPLQLHYAGQDERITSGWPAYESALKAAGVSYEAFVYPGVQHGFNNDTTPRYDATAAGQAWQRTVAFLKKHLA